jgi:hypothetical protein
MSRAKTKLVVWKKIVVVKKFVESFQDYPFK